MEHARQHSLAYMLVALLAGNFLIWSAVARADNALLRVTFLDVGQGDAIFIEAPGGVQMLIDGGPDRSVLRELGRVMPFYDRSIDVVLVTHSDKDHIAGLIPVLERYEVAHVVGSGTANDTSYAVAFERAVTDGEVAHSVARRGMRIDLGRGVYFDILFPDRDLPGLTDQNTGSIIGRLVYGETEFMLTGDAPASIEQYLVSVYGDMLASDVLKAGHHGSRTSSHESFVAAVAPAYAVISAGADNSYGHPHGEVLDTLKRAHADIVSTSEGRASFVSDGGTLYVR